MCFSRHSFPTLAAPLSMISCRSSCGRAAHAGKAPLAASIACTSWSREHVGASAKAWPGQGGTIVIICSTDCHHMYIIVAVAATAATAGTTQSRRQVTGGRINDREHPRVSGHETARYQHTKGPHVSSFLSVLLALDCGPGRCLGMRDSKTTTVRNGCVSCALPTEQLSDV